MIRVLLVDDHTVLREGMSLILSVEEDIEEIEEIPCPPEEEEVQPQRIRVARQRHNKWVFHEEDWSGASSRQIRRTLEKLYSQVQVPSCRFPNVGDGFRDDLGYDECAEPEALRQELVCELGTSSQDLQLSRDLRLSHDASTA